MSKMTSVTVEWFDELKGIGEGLAANGTRVFLNSKYIQATDTFCTLKAQEKISCELNTKDGSVYALNILRNTEPRFELERSSFIEPRSLESEPETSI